MTKYELNFINLKRNIESYPFTIGKFLALNRHMALTVAETKAVKADSDWMKALWEEKFQPLACASNKTDSPAESSEDQFESNFRHSYHNTMDPEFVEKLLACDRLNNDQLSMRLKLLSELKLPQEDVVISSVKIGQGGFGEVYLGNYKRKFKVAIKTIRNLNDAQAEIKRRSIENELLLMKYLGNYPTVLSCYGYVMLGSSMQIVLELAPYGSLDKVVRDVQSFPSFPFSLVIAWLCDLADAMKFLHSKNIKHRDIKAENLLIFDNLHLKLCDFGPAKQHFVNVTAESRIGTFCFMAPEIRMGKVSELASDIFSFAMTAIQVLTRKNPKIDNFKGQIVEALSRFNFPNKDTGKKLSLLLTACVAYDPTISPSKLRPTSTEVAEELIDILEEDLGGDPRNENAAQSEETKALELLMKQKQQERQEMLSKQAQRSNQFFRPQSAQFSVNKLQNRPTVGMGLKAVSADPYDFPQQMNPAFGSRDDLDNASVVSSVTMGNTVTFPMAVQDAEEKTRLAKYFRNTVGLTAKQSQQTANILVRTGVLTIEILKRRLVRNPDLLLDLGIDEDVAHDITEHFMMETSSLSLHSKSEDNIAHVNPQRPSFYSRPMNNSSSRSISMSLSMTSTPSPAFNEKLRSSNYSLSGSSDEDYSGRLPSEISRLYYDASQCNNQESYEKLQEIAARGHNLAECYLMRIYALGQCGLKKDIALARDMGNHLLPWLQASYTGERRGGVTDLSMMYIKYLIGVCYSEGLGIGMDKRESIRWYKMSADDGYSAAQAYLASCYFSGIGVTKNHSEAVRYYTMAAEQGYAGAQCNLGLCYEHGFGVERDYRMAAKWYRLSADQGDAAGLYNLGLCYEKGMRVEQDWQEAFAHFHESAVRGYVAAQYSLGCCYYFGNGVEQDLVQAAKWLRAAAEKGFVSAQTQLGLCYENGHGVEQDFKEALYWYGLAAEKGDAAAQYYYGFCYFSGAGVEKNLEKAVEYYKLSSQKNYSPALNNLGFCYFNGIGVVKNYQMAVKYYKASADQGYGPAQYNMGYCYEKGFGVPKKLNMVIRYYRLAAQNGNKRAKNKLLKFC